MISSTSPSLEPSQLKVGEAEVVAVAEAVEPLHPQRPGHNQPLRVC